MRKGGGKKSKVKISLVLVLFMAEKTSLLQMWRDADAVTVILLMMEKRNGFCCFPKVL